MARDASGGAGFEAIRGLIRLLLALFYRRIEVVGLERVPAAGGVIVAANHHNSVVDAMVLLAIVPRRLRTLAKAQLFQHPLIGPFLRLLGALPVHRRQEAGDDPRKNDALFAETTRTLREGGGIIIFPEGRTQPEPVLLELRTGAARMLLAAQPAEAALVPAGLVFRKPGIFREGEVLVLFGEPMAVDAHRALALREPEEAARRLTQELTGALKELIVEAEDLDTLALLELAEGVDATGGTSIRAGEARLRWLQEAAARYRRLARAMPERVAALAQRLRAFTAELDAAGLSLHGLARPVSAAEAAVSALRKALVLLVGAPLAFAGMLIHGMPYNLIGLVLPWVPHTGEEVATNKMAGGLLFYPAFWLLEGWLVWRIGGGAWFVAFLVLLLPSGLVAIAWRERLASAARELRGAARRLRAPGLGERLRAEREALRRELASLAQSSEGTPT